MSLGTAFEDLSRGPGMAYFPAISLSFKESVAFNFGSRPLRYPFGKRAVGLLGKSWGSREGGFLPQGLRRLAVGPGSHEEEAGYSCHGCRGR